MRSNREGSSRMNDRILVRRLRMSRVMEIRIMNKSNSIWMWSFIVIKVRWIRKRMRIMLNDVLRKRSNKWVLFRMSCDRDLKVRNKWFRGDKR